MELRFVDILEVVIDEQLPIIFQREVYMIRNRLAISSKYIALKTWRLIPSDKLNTFN